MRRHGYKSRRYSYEGFPPSLVAGVILGAAALTLAGGKYAEHRLPAEKALNIIENTGYEEAVVTDSDIFGVQMTGCGKGDFVKHEVSAVSTSTGNTVEFDVCGGLLKGATALSN
jgi:hypothetical protein